MQNKTTIRYNLIPVRMFIFNTLLNNKCCEDVEKRETSCTVGGMQTGPATVENSMEGPQKLKTGTAYDPAIPLRGI